MTEQQTDILIVGGGPAGMMAGITAAQFAPHKKVLVVRPEADAVIPCGIPYIFGTLGGTDEDMAGRAPLLAAGGQLQIGRVESIDRGQRTANLASGDIIHWERLVLATGSENFIPPIPGTQLAGVFSIQKDYEALDQLFSTLIPKINTLAIIGGGFIGVEFADEIRKRGITVHIIEMLPHLLQAAFDLDACTAVEKQLRDHGVQIHTQCKVEALLPDAAGNKVAQVQIAGQPPLAVDAVLIAIGTRPNVALARAMGRPELAGDARFATLAQRLVEENSQALHRIMDEWAAGHTQAEIDRLGGEYGFAASPVYSEADTYGNEH
ncbi:MAG: FAD-dependent oxidoreductase, partial [Candidatus Igneacidithiobacillus chanchocoensis]